MSIEALNDDKDDRIHHSLPPIRLWNGRALCPEPAHFPKVKPVLNPLPQVPRFKREVVEIILDGMDRVPAIDIIEQNGFVFADVRGFDKGNFTYALADQNQPEVILCKGAIYKAWNGVRRKAKKVGKEIEKGAKKAAHVVASEVKQVAHEVKKGAEKVNDWVKEHKTEVIIGGVVVAAAVAAYYAPVLLPLLIGAVPTKDDDDPKKPSDNNVPDPLAHRPDPFAATTSPAAPNDLFASNNYGAISHLDPSFTTPPLPSQNPLVPEYSHVTPPRDYNYNPPVGAHHFDNQPSGNLVYQPNQPWVNPFPPGVSPVGYTANMHKPAETVPLVIDPTGPVGIYDGHPNTTPSHMFVVPGKEVPRGLILAMNGIGNPLAEARSHAEHLQRLSGGFQINWIYSPTVTPLLDVVDAAVGLAGHLSPEAIILQQELRKFDEDHKDDPNVKCLVQGHSRAAIHVKNALENLSPEIRNRAIVVAIAPAVVVPTELCFRSFNYASKNDPVNLLPNIGAGLDCMSPHQFEALHQETHKELILLDRHPDGKFLGHGYQDPIFQRVQKYHLEQYVQGNYDPAPYEGTQ